MTVRCLLVADETPWPADTGYRQRLSAVLRGLAAAGPVDVVTVLGGDQQAERLPADLLPDRLGEHRVVTAPWRRPAAAAARFATHRDPHWVTGRRWPAVSQVVPTGAHDLVWFSHGEMWRALQGVAAGVPAVVDLDNVMSMVVRRRARTTGRVERRLLASDARRWARLERAAVRDAAGVVVCSALDAARLTGSTGRGSVHVVPNGALAVEDHRPERPERPVLLLVGTFDYAPNADAAVWFADEVLPRVRRAVPGAVLRLVGRTGGAVDALSARSGVEVTGRVPSVLAELRAAAVAVVPVRYGGGTRVKLVEALAAGVPVVATTAGAEGLDVVPGQHLLVADDAAGTAAACVTLLTDSALARRLGAAGRALQQERYTWDRSESCVTELARALVRQA